MKKYFLSSHVHICLADEHIVFLDLKDDKYFYLPPEVAKYNKPLIDRRAIYVPIHIAEEQLKDTIDDLVRAGVFVPDYSAAEPPDVWLPAPEQEFSEAILDGRPTINWHWSLIFFKAFLLAIIGIKIRGIHGITKHLSSFNTKNNGSVVDVERLEKAVSYFRYIRVVFYTAHKECFFDCIVMMYFLRMIGFRANWVFGVTMKPFTAHCWVQLDDIVLSDYVEKVFPFHAIMVV